MLNTVYYVFSCHVLCLRESWEECAVRETLEETGLTLTDVEYAGVVNAVEVEKDYHYITLFMKGHVDINNKREPENLEPEKCEGK